MFKEVEQKLGQKLLELSGTNTSEQTFVKLECLFYDVLSLGRSLEPNALNNSFLTALEKIKTNAFNVTQQPFKRASQREVAIKKFKTAFKKELSSYLKIVKC